MEVNKKMKKWNHSIIYLILSVVTVLLGFGIFGSLIFILITL